MYSADTFIQYDACKYVYMQIHKYILYACVCERSIEKQKREHKLRVDGDKIVARVCVCVCVGVSVFLPCAVFLYYITVFNSH